MDQGAGLPTGAAAPKDAGNVATSATTGQPGQPASLSQASGHTPLAQPPSIVLDPATNNGNYEVSSNIVRSSVANLTLSPVGNLTQSRARSLSVFTPAPLQDADTALN